MSKKKRNHKNHNNNTKFTVTKNKKSAFEIIMIGLMIIATLTMGLSMFFLKGR